MSCAYIGVGSNIDPERNVRRALLRLADCVTMERASTFYRSAPLGRPEQDPFVNGVVQVVTDLPPSELKQQLRALEAALGRARTADRYAARTIDLDILIYDEMIVSGPSLRLPDPEIVSRAFLAVPLGEIAPDVRLPGDGRTLREIAALFSDHTMEPLCAYSAELKEALFHGS